MNEVIQNIKSRRSIRKYKGKNIHNILSGMEKDF